MISGDTIEDGDLTRQMVVADQINGGAGI